MGLPDLGLVSVFVKVAELESFTAAATALNLPKSSVSRSVSQLEEGLGVRLLQRTSRTLSLTDAGRAFYERVRDPLSGLLDAMTDAAEASREPRGTIRFTAPPDLGAALLAEPIGEFVREHPQIRVDVVLTGRIVDLIAERFDLALRATARLDDSTLVARRLHAPSAGLYASRSYLERRGVPQTVEELATHDCVLFRAHDGRATWRLRHDGGEEHVTVRGPVTADDLGFVRRIVSEGVGIAALPTGIVERRGDLVRVLPSHTMMDGGSLYLVMPSGRHVPARVALFRDFLVQRVKLAFAD